MYVIQVPFVPLCFPLSPFLLPPPPQLTIMVQLYHLLNVFRVVVFVGDLSHQVLRKVAKNTCNPVGRG